uniref:Uncharacterized protein n=1 Tax=Kalanchoe fedtschenkoi TaxID=63787 RepID=A0A7N0T1G7_KALFE
MDTTSGYGCWLRIVCVVLAFSAALFLGAIKAVLVGPIAGLILIMGNLGVILGLFPAHVGWTIFTVIKSSRFDAPLKVAILLALPALFVMWLALSIVGSVLVGVGYGFFTPWVSTFEAFRLDGDSVKFKHCVVDGTLGTVKGSCTVVRDFADCCYHSYPLYLKELREFTASDGVNTLRLIHVPACIIVAIVGLIVEVPLFTVIAVIKSPYLLFKGWFRLIHDLVSREGPFLETACIPIAGLAILLWPLVVISSILVAIFSSIFIGLYGSIVVFQERSFRRGIAFVIAMVAEFDEYTNDWLYLREGTILPKPGYRKKKVPSSAEISVREGYSNRGKTNSSSVLEAPAMLVPSLAHSRSVREAIQDVQMVQVWGQIMNSLELRGKELLDANVITPVDLCVWLKASNSNEAAVIGVGLPCYSLFQTLVTSIKSDTSGIMMFGGLEINSQNRPQDRLVDWFFHPVMVLKEQIRVLKLDEGEVKFLEKLILFGSDNQRKDSWNNGSLVPRDALRAAQIQGISRRMTGLVRSVTKLPTYRRRFRHVVKALAAHFKERDGSVLCSSTRSSMASSNDFV